MTEDEFQQLLDSITHKRAKIVIDHIRKHGFVTSEELTNLYGYSHPPRAVRDVRERGVPIVTYKVKGADGKNIAAYKFGDPSKVQLIGQKSTGRSALGNALKEALIEKYGPKCFIYNESMEPGKLQVDHRVPYEIGGEHDVHDIDYFMLLSPSANRAKSWACEHCPNWQERKPDFCLKCYWAHPESYEHVAGVPERRLAIMFTKEEVAGYEALIKETGIENAQNKIKELIRQYVK